MGKFKYILGYKMFEYNPDSQDVNHLIVGVVRDYLRDIYPWTAYSNEIAKIMTGLKKELDQRFTFIFSSKDVQNMMNTSFVSKLNRDHLAKVPSYVVQKGEIVNGSREDDEMKKIAERESEEIESMRNGQVQTPPIPDPWVHRDKSMRCKTCMWYVEKEPKPKFEFIMKGDTVTDMVEKPKLGRCRRHAPTMNGYPAVFPTDWCGDHKLDENKI